MPAYDGVTNTARCQHVSMSACKAAASSSLEVRVVWCGAVCCVVFFRCIYNYLMRVFFTEEKRGGGGGGVCQLSSDFWILTSCPGRCGVMKGARDSWADRDAWYCRRDPFVGSE